MSRPIPCDFAGKGPCRGPVRAVDHYGPSMFDPPCYACEAHADALSFATYIEADGLRRPLYSEDT